MEINNFDQIQKLLEFEGDDTFYLLQIISRKKENPKLVGKNKIHKSYFIRNIKYLCDRMHEIKSLCNTYNARAYINLNPKSFKRMVLDSFSEMSLMVQNETYHKIVSLPETLAGKQVARKGCKKWLLDIDIPHEEFTSDDALNLVDALDECEPIGNKIIDTIITAHGFHVITKPFNLNKFESYRKTHDIVVHKNNPTILYHNYGIKSLKQE